MKVLVVSGIWPPDVGGPATPRARARGVPAGSRPRAAGDHDGRRAARAAPATQCDWVAARGSRRASGTCASLAAVRRAGPHGRRRLRDGDVRPQRRSASRSRGGRSSLKLTADPAFERARRRGLYGGTLAEFQAGALRRRTGRCARRATAVVRRAAHVVCPSAYLAELTAIGWGVPPERVTVLPNPAPDVSSLPERDELRARHGFERRRSSFAGRLTAQKSLELAIARHVSAGVRARVAGDGPDRARLEALGGRVRSSARSRARRARALPRSRRLVLSSAWENFPHARRRGARGRNAGDRDARRRRCRGRPRRRERPARPRGRRAPRSTAAIARVARRRGLAARLARRRRSVGRAATLATRVYGRCSSDPVEAALA